MLLVVGGRFAFDGSEPSADAFFLEEGGRRPDDACFVIAWSLELVSSPHETTTKSSNAPTSISISSGVSWEELTRSKLQAPSYEAAGNRAPTTDHRLPITKTIVPVPLCMHRRQARPDYRLPITDYKTDSATSRILPGTA